MTSAQDGQDDLILEVENLVKANRYAQALERLQEIENYRTEAILLSSRLNRINKQSRIGTITDNQAKAQYIKLAGDILDILHKPSGGAESARTVPPNPFVPWRGRLTDATHFFGRERELRELTQLVASRQSISLLGERRVGKSSLLHQLIGRAGRLSPAPECLYIDMQGVADEADFYNLVLDKLGGTGDTWRAFRNTIEGQYILLALDEFERARRENRFSFQLRRGLRALAQEGLTLVIATLQPLDRLFTDSEGRTSPLFNLCQRYRLGPLTETEARGCIAAYLAPTGVLFSEDEIAEALRLSEGHPGRLQQVSWHLYEARRRPDYDWRAHYRADPKE